MTDSAPDTARAETAIRVGLASASPRRHALLRSLGLEPVALRAGVDERRAEGEAVADFVQRLARDKARHGATDPAARGLAVIGGDTEVCLGETALGKPSDADDAARMLSLLSGRVHTVWSAVALHSVRGTDVRAVATRIEFRTLTTADIDAYVASGEPFGKAGAYAIQGLGGVFVRHLSGSYSAVVGLPVFETAELLRRAGVDPLRSAGAH